MLAEADSASDLGEGDGRDDARASFGQLALVEVGKRGEEHDGHRETEHRVPEELETLVVRDAAVLVRIGTMRERSFQQLRIDVDAELLDQRGLPGENLGHDRSDQMSATLRPLYSRNSSVPCESVTTFAW